MEKIKSKISPHQQKGQNVKILFSRDKGGKQEETEDERGGED